MTKKILINHSPWQTRIGILRDEKLENIYFDSHTSQSLERSFIKGIVMKVLPGIQTAFVDIGQERAGFLHISEIDRDLAIKKMGRSEDTEDEDEDFEDFGEDGGRERRDKRSQRKPLDIRKILKEKEAILVQVNKEPVGSKGAKLSRCFTIPGRFIVFMPNIPRIGISKKIEDPDERVRLRALVKSHLPEGMGAIIRTTSDHQDDKEIIQDINYLVKTWSNILKRFDEAAPREKIHQDIDLCPQIVRDNLDRSVESIICDDRGMFDTIYSFVKSIASDEVFKVKLHTGPQRLFDLYNIEAQVQDALSAKVHLKSGGSIVIEATEAMTVVDVNTGRFLGSTTSLEDTILTTNLEAAKEIVRQLRLRNIGGIIVIDFIDLATASNQQKLYKAFERMLREGDKFQSVVLKVSEFGLVQMTRKRSGKTLMNQIMSVCACCNGLGMINSLSTEAYLALREIESMLMRRSQSELMIALKEPVLKYVTAIEYNSLIALEKRFNAKITLSAEVEPLADET